MPVPDYLDQMMERFLAAAYEGKTIEEAIELVTSIHPWGKCVRNLREPKWLFHNSTVEHARILNLEYFQVELDIEDSHGAGVIISARPLPKAIEGLDGLIEITEKR
jgi:hypothetical protein